MTPWRRRPTAAARSSGTGGWLGITDKYWAAVVAPEQDQPYQGRFSVSGAAQPKNYQTDVLENQRDGRARPDRRRH